MVSSIGCQRERSCTFGFCCRSGEFSAELSVASKVQCNSRLPQIIAEMPLDFHDREARMMTRIIVRYFFLSIFISFYLVFFISSRQRDEASSSPQPLAQNSFQRLKKIKVIDVFSCLVDRKGKIGGTWFSPTFIYIRGERDFKGHNWMSVLSPITDKKCKTSKRRRNFDSFQCW